jgi:hypothetical protein
MGRSTRHHQATCGGYAGWAPPLGHGPGAGVPCAFGSAVADSRPIPSLCADAQYTTGSASAGAPFAMYTSTTVTRIPRARPPAQQPAASPQPPPQPTEPAAATSTAPAAAAPEGTSGLAALLGYAEGSDEDEGSAGEPPKDAARATASPPPAARASPALDSTSAPVAQSAAAAAASAGGSQEPGGAMDDEVIFIACDPCATQTAISDVTAGRCTSCPALRHVARQLARVSRLVAGGM